MVLVMVLLPPKCIGVEFSNNAFFVFCNKGSEDAKSITIDSLRTGMATANRLGGYALSFGE
jgi:hypothetical protein